MTASRTAFRIAVLAAAVCALALVPAAFAAKGGGGGGGGGKPHGGGGTTGGTGSLTLRMVDPADTVANWGDQITWDVSTTATTQPNVDVTCKQNGVVVYGASAGFYAGYPWPWTQIMTLSSQAWSGGSADCVGRLYYISGTSTVTLASKSFTVAA